MCLPWATAAPRIAAETFPGAQPPSAGLPTALPWAMFSDAEAVHAGWKR